MSTSDIMPCIKIDKLLVVNILIVMLSMMSITVTVA